jgi:hypothetical protein
LEVGNLEFGTVEVGIVTRPQLQRTERFWLEAPLERLLYGNQAVEFLQDIHSVFSESTIKGSVEVTRSQPYDCELQRQPCKNLQR